MKLAALILVSVMAAEALDLPKIAAATTIVVNILDARANIQKIRTAAKAMKRAGKSVARKVKKGK